MGRLIKLIAATCLAALLLPPQISQAEPLGAEIDGQITAEAAILTETKTGRVLYEKNAQAKMYPASMTKILTAMLVLDYFQPDEMVVCGPEVNNVPYGSSLAGNFNGESLSVENMIRLLIIPSGNETACVAARVVAERAQANTDMTYAQKESLFCNLMNEKAKSLGATRSNFVNPHGYHDDNHYTTPEDMALIAQTAMADYPLIAQVAGEKKFVGNGAGESPDPILKTQFYEWETHNQLIGNDEYAYEYATGIKTGFTDEAGDCVAASAAKGERSMIAIIMNSPEPGRWNDAKTLFEYGFNTFADRDIQVPGTEIGETVVANTTLGMDDSLVMRVNGGYRQYLSRAEADAVVRRVTFDETLFADTEALEAMNKEKEKNWKRESDAPFAPISQPAVPSAETPPVFAAPMTAGTILGKVTYTLDGEVIFEDDIVATRDLTERTFKSDMTYRLEILKATVFSVRAIPFWIGSAVAIVALIALLVSMSRRRRRNRNNYHFRRRY